jgi:predicted RND superfamily exporter protein
MLKRLVVRVVDGAGARPWTALFIALLVFLASALAATRLELRTELRELLPRESDDYKAYEHQAGRVGGGATLFVVVESSDAAANRKFVDEVAAQLQARITERARCRTACSSETCRAQCGEELIRHVEANTLAVKAFFEKNAWVYASRSDLEKIDQELEDRIGSAVFDLNLEEDAGAAEADKKKRISVSERVKEMETTLGRKLGLSPSGYFTAKEGTIAALRIVSRTGNMGDARGARLLDEVSGIAHAVRSSLPTPDMTVGFGGDIPNALEEQHSLATEAISVTILATLLILGGVVFFYRSPWSIIVIGFPAALGACVGYAFAALVYGYVNTVGAFLGAIIIGNGINYPIVLLSRYRDFRARGMAPDEARRQAVLNAFRAELVGACVAAIAYGSLTITDFRGFSQFGTIGFVGMLAVWLAIIPLVPALVVLVERAQARLPTWLRDPPPRVTSEGATGPLTELLSHVVVRHPVPILVTAALLAAVALAVVPRYLQDPWEYNFARLGSQKTRSTGAGVWSKKADAAFGGRSNVASAMMVADSPEQVALIKAELLAKDAKSAEGRVIADVVTVADLLPGTAQAQKERLEVLERIRKRLTPRVVDELKPDERRYAEQLLSSELKVLRAADLPAFIQRRFQENNGTVGTVYYVKYNEKLSLSDGHNLLRIAAITERVRLPNGEEVITASRAGVFAEMIRSISRDGPIATAASFCAVVVVVVLAVGNAVGAAAVIGALVLGVLWLVGCMAAFGVKLNFLNFIALPITFGIGCEYPFNLFDRARLLSGDVALAVRRSAGPVALCSYTTLIGYGSLAFADNQALQSFGKVAALGEFTCTVAALLVLPAALQVLSRSERLRRSWMRTRGSGIA